MFYYLIKRKKRAVCFLIILFVNMAPLCYAPYEIRQSLEIDCSGIADTNIMQISIPKCGTHLLSKCIKILTGREVFMFMPGRIKPNAHYYASIDDMKALTTLAPGGYWVSHLVYKKEYADFLAQSACAKIFIYRDPRDQIMSFIFYTRIRPAIWPQAKHMTVDELIFDLIDASKAAMGDPPGRGVAGVYDNYLPWIHVPGVLSIKFEDLVGDNGGGSKQKQYETIRKISQHIGLNITDTQVAQVSEQLFGGTGTFRKGRISSWRDYFTPEHKKAFKKAAGQLLIDLGYEQDLNW